MSNLYHWMDKAAQASANSNHDRVKIGAAVVRGNYLISTGWNQKKSHPMQARYNVHRNLECSNYIHAEIHALVRSGREDLEDATIYVYRSDKSGDEANCKPCAACTRAIYDAGITRVYYTTAEGIESYDP